MLFRYYMCITFQIYLHHPFILDKIVQQNICVTCHLLKMTININNTINGEIQQPHANLLLDISQ